jgi:hypothetical protein
MFQVTFTFVFTMLGIGEQITLPDVKLDVVIHCAILVERLTGLVDGHKEKRLEGDLTLSHEVSVCKGSVCVFGDALVELVVVAGRDFIWLSSPDWLGLVDKLPIPSCLLNLFGLWLVLW